MERNNSSDDPPQAPSGAHGLFYRFRKLPAYPHVQLYLQPSVLAWPASFVLASAILWISILADLSMQREHAIALANKDVVYLAKAYAEQMHLTIGQIDQITQSIKYIAENARDRFKLEEEINSGVYAINPEMYLSIFNRDGEVLSSSSWATPGGKPISRKIINIRDREYFKVARDNPTSGLFISKPEVGRLWGRTVIRFSRRVNAPDGSFDGVILIAVAPEYLARFFDPASVRSSDYLSLRSVDGDMFVSKVNNEVVTTPTLLRRSPVFAGDGHPEVYQENVFYDSKARVMASSRVAKYPLIAVAGVTTSDVLVKYQHAASNAMTVAGCVTLLFLLVASVGARSAARSGRRKAETDIIMRTYLQAIDGSEEGYFSVRAERNKRNEIVDFILDECNERGAGFLQRTRAELIGSRCTEFFPGRGSIDALTLFKKAMETGSLEDEFHAPAGPGRQESWIARRMVRTMNGLAITVRNVTQTKLHIRQLDVLTYTDTLTSLPNRSWLSQHLPVAIDKARAQQCQIALLNLDLDDFQNVNNTVGHAGGDIVLEAIATRLKCVIRAEDHVVRMGADEFAILMIDASTADMTKTLAMEILSSLAQNIVLPDGSSQILSASIGISVYPTDGETGDILIKHAGVALYAAKKAGKARCQYYEEHLSELLTVRRNIEADLRHAIANDEFVLHYQPRVDTQTGEIVSMEALLRWLHPIRGMVAPLDFILLAEETGQIIPIGAIVIDKVCQQIAQWKGSGIPVVPVSINVSPRQFNQGNVRAVVEHAMQLHGVHPSFIEIEITESCMMGNDKAVALELASIQAMGVKLLVDDFGTGYSSLSQLQRLDLDVLKVDRAFTSNLGGGPEGEIFFQAIISMAHGLGMGVVAEGVESLEQMQILQKIGCDEVQGYLISRPVSSDAMSALLRKRNLLPAS